MGRRSTLATSSYADLSVVGSAYRTSSSVHGDFPRCSFGPQHDKHQCTANVHYMAHEDRKVADQSRGFGRQTTSETKDNFRPPPQITSSVHIGIFSLPGSAKYRDEPDRSFENGHSIFRDPYVTTSRLHHADFYASKRRPVTAPVTRHEAVTFWSRLSYPKTTGLGVSKRELWTPSEPDIKHAAWGHEAYARRGGLRATTQRPTAYVTRGYTSETMKSFMPTYNRFLLCKA